jgi:integrase/recombinase XerC/integrase/recombinase XerD
LEIAIAHPGGDNETLINEYLEWKRSYAPPAARMYARWVRLFQEATNKAPEAITLGDWIAFARSLEGRFTPKSVEFALNIIHNYLRFWYEQGRLRRLPLYLARVPRAMARSHNAATEDEYRAMVSALKREGSRGLRDLAIIMLLHDTGMRVGEVAALEIEQIEEDASATIRTEKTVQRRRVFWNKSTDEVLHELIVQRINSHAKSDWLFVAKRGHGETPLTTRMMQRIMHRVCRLAGIERRLSPHSFRHAYIHRLAYLGTPDAIIAQLVGHSTPFTIAHYTKLSRPEFSDYARRQFAVPEELAVAA